jgi:hypothetical protein
MVRIYFDGSREMTSWEELYIAAIG